MSTDLRNIARQEKLSSEASTAWRRLAIELDDLAQQLYWASFVDNDAKISELSRIIKESGEEADRVSQELKEAANAFKKAREFTQGATEVVDKIGEQAKNIKEKLDTVEKILGNFGIEVELG
jgi:methyl-accepting chemotaxis protein